MRDDVNPVISANLIAVAPALIFLMMARRRPSAVVMSASRFFVIIGPTFSP
jgi:hypothetical protein